MQFAGHRAQGLIPPPWLQPPPHSSRVCYRFTFDTRLSLRLSKNITHSILPNATIKPDPQPVAVSRPRITISMRELKLFSTLL
jgi:hypothetical protein